MRREASPQVRGVAWYMISRLLWAPFMAVAGVMLQAAYEGASWPQLQAAGFNPWGCLFIAVLALLASVPATMPFVRWLRARLVAGRP